MPLAKRLRHRIEYVAFLALAGLIRALPVETASKWSGAGWRLVAPLLPRHRRALSNLSLAFPEKSPAEIRAIAMGMWDNLGRTFAEFFHLDEIVNGDRIQFEPPELFESIRGRGGAVACSLHMANWEIASQAGPPAGLRPAGVYQRIVNPFVDRYVKAIRAPLYPGGLWEKSPQVARNMLRMRAGAVARRSWPISATPRGFPRPSSAGRPPRPPFPPRSRAPPRFRCMRFGSSV